MLEGNRDKQAEDQYLEEHIQIAKEWADILGEPAEIAQGRQLISVDTDRGKDPLCRACRQCKM